MDSDSPHKLSTPPVLRGRSTEQVRRDIARGREALADTAQELRTQVAEKIDWRTWVRDNPAPMMIGAFALGFWIAWRD